VSVRHSPVAERGHLPSMATERTRDTLAIAIAAVGVVLVGLDVQIKQGVTTGTVAMLVLAPVWARTTLRLRGAKALFVLLVAAIVSGRVLGYMSAADHDLSSKTATFMLALVTTGLGSVGLMVWATTIVGTPAVVLLFALGDQLNNLLHPYQWASDPWKFGFALPVTLMVMALLARRSARANIGALAALGAVSVLFNYRSFFGFCALSALILLWQAATASSRRRISKASPLLLIAALAISLYFTVSSLLVNGTFGTELQQRSVAQIDASGSLIVGGRPEWSATLQLMRMQPFGFGLGVVPNSDDLNAGKAGFASINVDYNNGYVENYMFGGDYHMHSVIADLWTHFGLIGLALAAFVMFLLLRHLSVTLAAHGAAPLVIFMTAIALWDLGFGPIFTNLKDVVLALVLVLAGYRSQLKSAPPESVATVSDVKVRRRTPTA
jgi:hypothetical protein